MKRFRFRGDALLKLRRSRLDRLAASIAAIEQARVNEQAELSALQQQAHRAAADLVARDRISSTEISAVGLFSSHLERAVAQNEAAEQERGRRLDVLRQQLHQARVQARLLERLRERRLDAHTKTEQSKEEAAASETAILRNGRQQ